MIRSRSSSVAETLDPLAAECERDWQTYVEHLDVWKKTHPHGHVAVDGALFEGPFETYGDAIAAGFRRFGVKSFSIFRVGEAIQEADSP